MRIIVCDDQQIVRDGIKMMLDLEPDIDVIATAKDGAQAVDLVAEKTPDLILMDLKMPVMNGIEATRRIRSQCPHIPVLILTTYDADEWVFDALSAGATGYLLKDTPREQLVAAVRGTVNGLNFIDPAIAGKLIGQVSGQINGQINGQLSSMTSSIPSNEIPDNLTKRETEILILIAEGQTNHSIAQSLFLSDGTVRNYVSQVLAKLDVSDRTQAAAIAWRSGLMQRRDAG